MQWISVKDRLPEFDQLVVIYRRRAKKYMVARYGENVWWSDGEMISKGAVTHWMPLPEPPKE